MPVDLLSLGAAASGLGSLAGGLLGASSAKKSTKEAKRQFNVQMNESIQRRVKDAEAAGVHPLFALGASTGVSPTMHAGQSDTGSMIGEAIAGAGRAATDYSKGKGLQRVQQASIRSAEANATRDEAEAQLALSRSKKLEQEMSSRGHDGFRSFPVGSGPSAEPLYFGPAEPFNNPVASMKQKGVVSGTHGAQQDYVFDDGRSIRTYSDQMQADEIKQADILYRRAIHKGSDALVWFENQLKKRGIPYRWMRGGR